MIIEKRMGRREKDVVALLHENLALTSSGIRYLLKADITDRRIQQVLKNLYSKTIIKRFTDVRNGGHSTFYALDRKYRHLAQGLPYDLGHAENCTVWKNRLRDILPSAHILQFSQFKSNADAKFALLWDGVDRETIPDLLILARSKVENRMVTVAIEIERCHKSERRIINKLNRFSRGTHLDGVIYISPGDAIPERIQSIFENKIIAKADRINSYGDYFLLVSSDLGMKRDKLLPQNLKSESIEVSEWFEVLLRTRLSERKNADFAKPSVRRTV